MPWLAELALHLVRTLHLLALAVAPKWLSPEPLPPASLPLRGAVAALALAALLFLSARFASWVASRLAKVGAALLWVTVAAALGAAWYHSGRHAPLALGAPLVAVPAWAALATLAAAAAEQWLGSSFKHKRMASAIVVLAVGVTQLGGAAAYLASRERMWWSALRRSGSHERAVEELARAPRRKRDFDELKKIADHCLKLHPAQASGRAGAATCACLELRAGVGIHAGDATGAVRDAQVARALCADRKGARVILAEALAVAGHADAAEAEARAALDEGGDAARLHHAIAVAHQQSGRIDEARREAERAIDAGAGRDVRLYAGALAIVAGDLDAAVAWLKPLAKDDPEDDEVLYNLALIADKRGDYNGARQGYLAALKANPRNADARYNVALLTFRAGVTEESRHHVRKLIATFPDDPRGQALARTTGTPLGAQGAPAAPPGSAAQPPAPPQ